MSTKRPVHHTYTCLECFEECSCQDPLSRFGICTACGAVSIEDRRSVVSLEPERMADAVKMGFGGRC